MTRRYYRWDKDEGKLEELERTPPQPRVHLLTDRDFDNLRATDGADISSRTKYERYVKRNNLTNMSDFKETWEKAEAKREAFFKGGADETRHATVEKVKKLAYERPDVVKQIGAKAKARATAVVGRVTENIEE